jgi:pilus assembly protein Flp/PilA
MRSWLSVLRRLVPEQRAATAVEYGLIAALIVIAMIAGFQAVGSETTEMWNNVSSKVLNVT